MITAVNIYRAGGDWCYRADDSDGYDHSDVLDADSETEARAEVALMFPAATVVRVADIYQPA